MKYQNFFIFLFIIILIFISYKKYEKFSDTIEYIKHERNTKCKSNYKYSNNSNLEQCKSLCTSDLNCTSFTFSETNGCRYSFCNENSNNIKCKSDKQCDTENSTENDFLYVNKKYNYGYIQRYLESIYTSFKLTEDINNNKKLWNKTQKMQILIYQYLPYDSIVLEINGGHGSLSVLVNLLIKNPNYHFVTEMVEEKYNILKQNKSKNNLLFKTFNVAITNKRLMYRSGLMNEFSVREIDQEEEVPEDWIETNTMTYSETNDKSIALSGRDINTLILKEYDNFLINLIKNNQTIIGKIKTIIIQFNIFDIFQKELEDFLKEKGYVKIVCFCEKIAPDFHNKECHYAVWKYQ